MDRSDDGKRRETSGNGLRMKTSFCEKDFAQLTFFKFKDKLFRHGPLKLIVLVRRYLEFEHSLYCVPSNVSSGLANLPLDFVWFNGRKNTSWPTTKILPQTSEELSGKKAYSMILKYFTTNEMTPLEVHRLGQEQLDKLYPLVRAVVRIGLF